MTEMTALPSWLLAGVISKNRCPSVPLKTRFPLGMMLGLDDDAERLSRCSGVSASFTVKGTVNPSFRWMVWFVKEERVGGALFTRSNSRGEYSGQDSREA